jgi:hypothetical protein
MTKTDHEIRGNHDPFNAAFSSAAIGLGSDELFKLEKIRFSGQKVREFAETSAATCLGRTNGLFLSQLIYLWRQSQTYELQDLDFDRNTFTTLLSSFQISLSKFKSGNL